LSKVVRLGDAHGNGEAGEGGSVVEILRSGEKAGENGEN